MAITDQIVIIVLKLLMPATAIIVGTTSTVFGFTDRKIQPAVLGFTLVLAGILALFINSWPLPISLPS